MSEDEVISNQQRAALAGYPVAITNYGNRLVKGNLGVPQDTALGVAMLENAIQGGDGLAASSLAGYYTEGEYLPRDTAKARAYLEIAEAEGLSPATLKERAENLAKAEEALAGQAGSGTGSGSDSEQFAALAVSPEDGGFGFAHDYPDPDAARARALEECKSGGAKDCAVKMVGRGKGCMAYHSAGGSATAHGWAIGRTRAAVENRAAQECSARNGNAACGNSAWVCNDRTEAPLDVIYEAAMPTIAASGSSCRLHMFTNICNYDNRRYKADARPYRGLIIATALSEAYVFPDCGDKAGALMTFSNGGTWEKGSDIKSSDLSKTLSTRLGALAADYSRAVASRYRSACPASELNREVRIRIIRAEDAKETTAVMRRSLTGPNGSRIVMDFK